jgi:hypothetical protein
LESYTSYIHGVADLPRRSSAANVTSRRLSAVTPGADDVAEKAAIIKDATKKAMQWMKSSCNVA